MKTNIDKIEDILTYSFGGYPYSPEEKEIMDTFDELTKDYWQKGEPTEEGEYVVAMLGVMDDTPFYTICSWNVKKKRFEYWNYTHDCDAYFSMNEIAGWHKIKPYKDKVCL